MDKIRIGIVGYGNIGKGVEKAIARNEDMELAAVFTRRDPASVKIETKTAAVKSMDDMKAMKGEVDVMILCGGSATDLPVMGPQIAADFNTIDSFDTHARIPEYFANVDQAAKAGENVSIISVGWDSGYVFSEPSVCGVYPGAGKHLHLLGQGRQPGTFGCDPPDRGCEECHPVYGADRGCGKPCKKRK